MGQALARVEQGPTKPWPGCDQPGPGQGRAAGPPDTGQGVAGENIIGQALARVEQGPTKPLPRAEQQAHQALAKVHQGCLARASQSVENEDSHMIKTEERPHAMPNV